jgi:formylglycine-generating enzyme required for sulfatase activity
LREREKILEHYRREGYLPVEPGSGKSFKDFANGPEMVVVPSGVFVREFRSDLFEVTIQAPFAVSRFEVTFDEWDAAFAAGGVKYLPQSYRRGRYPVNQISWYDASEYVNWLITKTGQKYRLPSESEWEYSCRAGSATKFAFGDYITKKQASFGRGSAGPAKVGSFQPNAWGLYDMHGNVAEWCEDAYHDHDDISSGKPPRDGSVWEGGCPERRIIRGGNFYDDNQNQLRSKGGLSEDACERHAFFGIRVARSLAPSTNLGIKLAMWARSIAK